jgi:hypothetical protein
MSLFDLEDLVEDIGIPGVLIGVGAVVLAPIFGPALAKAGKPVAKAAIKGGIVFYEKSKIVMAEAGEAFGDLVAQSKAELATELDESSIVQVSNHPETN